MKYQFRIFGWTCLTCLLVLFPGLAMLMNIHEGMCWFLLPTFLIITNDIFAYLVGYFFGKRQLI
jgi:CDP-diglyceride synthetase